MILKHSLKNIAIFGIAFVLRLKEYQVIKGVRQS